MMDQFQILNRDTISPTLCRCCLMKNGGWHYARAKGDRPSDPISITLELKPVQNTLSRANAPVQLEAYKGLDGKFNDPIPSRTRLPPDS